MLSAGPRTVRTPCHASFARLALASGVAVVVLLPGCETIDREIRYANEAASRVRQTPEALMVGPPAEWENFAGPASDRPAFEDKSLFYGDVDFDDIEHGRDSMVVGTYTYTLDKAENSRRYQATWTLVMFDNFGFRKRFEGGSVLEPNGSVVRFDTKETFSGLWVPVKDDTDNDGQGIIMIGAGDSQPERYSIYRATSEGLTFMPGLGGVDEVQAWARTK